MKLRTLSLITFCLFALSLAVFYKENKRGTDLLSGSDFIKGLDIDKVSKMTITYSKEKKLVLKRDGLRFVLESHKNYPADTLKINDFIFKLASIEVSKKAGHNISESEADLKRFFLDKEGLKYKVEIFNAQASEPILAFLVSKDLKQKANYIKKLGDDHVYLAQNTIWFDSTFKDYIDTYLLKLAKDQIEEIEVQKKGKNLTLLKTKEGVEVKSSQKGEKIDKGQALGLFSKFTNLRFESYQKYNDPKIQELSFEKTLKLKTTKKLVYRLALAKGPNGHFLKINALTNLIPDEVSLEAGADTQKLKSVEELIKAREWADTFNLEKGSWVYRISEATYQSLTL